MNKKIADLILHWHNVYVGLGNCIESARVVLDQSNRGTLLPDRVREMRGELLNVQEGIPQLADLLEELTGETVWPMTDRLREDSAAPVTSEPTEEEEVSAEDDALGDPADTAEGDYDASGSTPGTDEAVDEEAAAEAKEESETGTSTVLPNS